jgi:signal transduction histidine kinase
MCTPSNCRYLSHVAHVLLAITPKGTIRSVGLHNAHLLGHGAESLEGKSILDFIATEDRRRLPRLFEQCRTAPAVWADLTFLAAGNRREPMLCCFQRLAGGDFPQTGILMTGIGLGAVRDDLRAEAASVLGQLAFRCHGPAHRLMLAVEAMAAEHPESEAAQQCRSELDALLEALGQATLWPQEFRRDRPINVVRVLEGALKLVDGDPAGDELRVTLRPEQPAAWASVAPEGLVFIALHLVSNAREAAGADGTGRPPQLLIDVHADADRIEIEFQDNGPGLDHEHLQCVFTPFFSTRHGKAGHAGVGLAACHQLVEFMGGRMRIQSRPSAGTTVLVSLPAAAAPV